MHEAEQVEGVSEWLWVYVEAAGVGRYGRVDRKHYDAVLSNSYTARFLPVQDIFWLSDGKPIRASQRGVAPLFQGTFQILVNYISILAPVEDCTALLLSGFSLSETGLSAWERLQESTVTAPKKRARKVAS